MHIGKEKMNYIQTKQIRLKLNYHNKYHRRSTFAQMKDNNTDMSATELSVQKHQLSEGGYTNQTLKCNDMLNALKPKKDKTMITTITESYISTQCFITHR